jgi:hypothetical protein
MLRPADRSGRSWTPLAATRCKPWQAEAALLKHSMSSPLLGAAREVGKPWPGLMPPPEAQGGRGLPWAVLRAVSSHRVSLLCDRVCSDWGLGRFGVQIRPHGPSSIVAGAQHEQPPAGGGQGGGQALAKAHATSVSYPEAQGGWG